MRDDELAFMPALALAGRIRSRDLSPVEVVEACLRRAGSVPAEPADAGLAVPAAESIRRSWTAARRCAAPRKDLTHTCSGCRELCPGAPSSRLLAMQDGLEVHA